MLNLSDKELDRLSREAADRHDPGDQVGPQSWERLELRLDKELGRIGPSPLHGIRRFPFYYAPVIILLVGVSYYFIRQGKSNTAKTDPSGSPPMTVVKPLSPVQNSPDLSTKTSENSDNSTPPHSSETSATPNTSVYPGSGAGTDHQAAAKEGLTQSPGSASVSRAPTSSGSASAGSTPTGEPGTAAASTTETATTTGSAPIGGAESAPNSTGSALTSIKPAAKTGSAASKGNTLVSPPGLTDAKTSGSVTRRQDKYYHAGLTSPGSTEAKKYARFNRSKNTAKPAGLNASKETDGPAADTRLAGGAAGTRAPGSSDGNSIFGNSDRNNISGLPGYPQGSAGSSGSTTPPWEPAFSTIQDARSLARQRGVDDSALRAAAAGGIAGPIRLDKKNPGLRISRPLQFGFSFSPDFASVHSLAGDRPGSSIGLTLDYQFSDRLYLSTGLLATRKNYASSPQDYHVPDNYYIRNNIHDVSLIKGSFYMLEIPLNLRYDFLLTGNTVFFLSGGASSYLMTSEHSQYYYNLFGRQTCQDFKGEGARRRNYLFSSINLSMGVETGLSNSLSLLIAPYVKVPTAGMGFGQVQVTSVGLNFALKYAPVLSRKRQH